MNAFRFGLIVGLLNLSWMISVPVYAFELIKPSRPFEDEVLQEASQYFYFGAQFTALVPTEVRHSVSPLFAISPYWGSDWNATWGFEGMMYRFQYKEDLYDRPAGSDPLAPQQIIYSHTGIRLRGLYYPSDKRYTRLRPLFEYKHVLLPYFGLGVQIEPGVEILDKHHPKYNNDVYWGAGFSFSFGFLHLFRYSPFRLRYEVNSYNAYTPTKTGNILPFLFSELHFSAGIEYSFSIKNDFKKVDVEVYGAFDSDINFEDKDEEGDALLLELSDKYSSVRSASLRSNLLDTKQEIVFYQAKKNELDISMIYKIQGINKEYREELEFNHMYEVIGMAPKGETERLEKKQMNLAKKRAILVSDLLKAGGVPKESISITWKTIDPLNPDDRADGSVDYVIVNNYLFEAVPLVDLNRPEGERTSSKSLKSGVFNNADYFFDPSEVDNNLPRQRQSDLIAENTGVKRQRLVTGEDDTETFEGIILDVESAVRGNLGVGTALDTRVTEEYYRGIDDESSDQVEETGYQETLSFTNPSDGDQTQNITTQDIENILTNVYTTTTFLEADQDVTKSITEAIESTDRDIEEDLSRGDRSSVLFFGPKQIALTGAQIKALEMLYQVFKETASFFDRIEISYWFDPVQEDRGYQDSIMMEARIQNIISEFTRYNNVRTWQIDVLEKQNPSLLEKIELKENNSVVSIRIVKGKS